RNFLFFTIIFSTWSLLEKENLLEAIDGKEEEKSLKILEEEELLKLGAPLGFLQKKAIRARDLASSLLL
ncbi:hypothetical protein, partial [Streptomyces plicatus]|uniref:hypothetical protein n=1 Tax=Streptomyces plicatus TaxID=1922 RepID=UPI00187603B4